jgi:hypothetical protein
MHFSPIGERTLTKESLMILSKFSQNTPLRSLKCMRHIAQQLIQPFDFDWPRPLMPHGDAYHRFPKVAQSPHQWSKLQATSTSTSRMSADLNPSSFNINN